jgi:hypothetical protein
MKLKVRTVTEFDALIRIPVKVRSRTVRYSAAKFFDTISSGKFTLLYTMNIDASMPFASIDRGSKLSSSHLIAVIVVIVGAQ